MRRRRRGAVVSLKQLRLSPKVRGVDSQYLHQGSAERKECLKVRPAMDFSEKCSCRRKEKHFTCKTTCIRTCLLRHAVVLRSHPSSFLSLCRYLNKGCTSVSERRFQQLSPSLHRLVRRRSQEVCLSERTWETLWIYVILQAIRLSRALLNMT